MPDFPDENTLGTLKKLRMGGRYLDAWNLIKDLAPPEDWPTQEGRLQGDDIDQVAMLIQVLAFHDHFGAVVMAMLLIFRAPVATHQKMASNEIAKNVERIASMVEANSQAVNQTAAATAELERLSAELLAEVDRFTV